MKKPTCDKYPKWVCWVWIISVISIALSITSFFGTYHNVTWNIESVSLGIILAFVGMLATFVVISNYAQVKDIEHKFNAKIEQIKEIELKFDAKIHEVKESYEIFLNKSIRELKCRIEIEFAINTGKQYEEICKYMESLNWYFTALEYALSENSPIDQLVSISLICSMIRKHKDELCGLNAVWREKYITKLERTTGYEREAAQEIFDFLQQSPSKVEDSEGEEIDEYIKMAEARQKTNEKMTSKRVKAKKVKKD